MFAGKKSCQLLVNAGSEIVAKYNYFKEFLEYNRKSLNRMAELEQLYYGGQFNILDIQKKYDELITCTRQLVQALNGLGGGIYADLVSACDHVDQAIFPLFHYGPCCLIGDLVLPLEALTPESSREAGGKATNLATMGNIVGLPIPAGFVVTAYAFERFIEETRLTVPLEMILSGLSLDDPDELEAQSRVIQEAIQNAPVPAFLADKILQAYEELAGKTQKNVHIAMRSSAVGEDTEASFAGQYITVLNVTKENILEAYKAVVASKYAARAILYRLSFGLDDRETPMCVAGIAMIDSSASGVMYTVQPTQPNSGILKVNSIWGLGEHLVSGEASPDEFYVDKSTGDIVQKNIGVKEERLVNLSGGGVKLEEVPAGEQSLPSLTNETVNTLARYGLKLEEYFQGPQDVEWAVDQRGRLFILQSRPLGLVQTNPELETLTVDLADYPILLSGGKTASPGIAVGTVFVATGKSTAHLPENAILVTRTASPDYAGLMSRIKGIITDIGSVTSHLSSVAREFGVPTIVDAGQATTLLEDGEDVTLVADQTTVYQGIVPELATRVRPRKKPMFDSPVHHRTRAILDKISPLQLTDPQAANFTPGGCQTIHDIIRFSHENAMKEMFGLSQTQKSGIVSARLTSNIPLMLHLIDLGGGLKGGLTTCDIITPEHLESLPMKAIWHGLSHPGITWKGTVAMDTKNFMGLIAQGAITETPSVDSFAILSTDYLNLSAKFGYHYANLDTFCSADPDQNYIYLQFSGGIGSYYGRSLRINFLATVFFRLGFKIEIKGDLLEASITGLDLRSMDTTLDQMGRLLASSRLLDMAIANDNDVSRMVEAFFHRDYDFLGQAESSRLPNFYSHTGNWKRVTEDSRTLLLQDGSEYGSSISSGVAHFMWMIVGTKYLHFLDNIEAHFYFPLAIAKGSEVSDAVLSVRVKPVDGSIDRAAGLAFGIKNIGNYFVFRVNALEDNVILFEYLNNRRFKRVITTKKIDSKKWYSLKIEIEGNTIKGYVDDVLLLGYSTERNLKGYVGLWSKADSITYFDELLIEAGGEKRVIEF
jgi:pyruvate,water dikinase